jgi:hypothetical protein
LTSGYFIIFVLKLGVELELHSSFKLAKYGLTSLELNFLVFTLSQVITTNAHVSFESQPFSTLF